MNRRANVSLLGASTIAISLIFSANAFATELCEPVSGKIVNNFVAQDGSGTLGVVAMVYGAKAKGNGEDNAVKLKCGLMGKSQSANPASIEFIHTISCDDSIPTPVGPLHSAIWLHTVGTFGPPEDGTQVATFQEESTVLPEPFGPAPTGIFHGATASSRISVKGVVYRTGAIDMKFEGQICKPGN
jgi:hypothetical protein